MKKETRKKQRTEISFADNLLSLFEGGISPDDDGGLSGKGGITPDGKPYGEVESRC